MYSRKEQTVQANFFPLEWQQEIEALLFDLYQEHCKKDSHGFQVHGITYPDEIILAVSYMSLKIPEAIPFTFLVSADLEESTNPQKLMSTLVDSMGLFFDQFFNSSEREHQVIWTDIEYKKQKLFYKTTRENLLLSIEADRILQDN